MTSPRSTAVGAAERLIAELDEQGVLTDPRVRRAMAGIERHRFLPDRIWLDDDRAEGGYALIDRHSEPKRWWQAAYGNTPVVTQLDDGGAARLDATWATPTSSASLPSAVAQMACAADLEIGMQVLEIGSATGINLALIAELVGQDNVVGIEIDPGIAERCRAALAATGYQHTTVITGDGECGYAPRAPYHRIISTASALTIPYPWVEQTRPGGLILTPFRTTLCSQGMVALVRSGEGQACGHFQLPLRFMLLRGQRAQARARFEALFTDQAWREARSHSRGIELDLTDWDTRFAIGLSLPGVHHGQLGEGWWLADDASWAYIDSDHVVQWGPRDLWDDATAAAQEWETAGRPDMTRYGLTVDANGQRFWLDSPDNIVPTMR